MLVQDFDYDLPEELIALCPLMLLTLLEVRNLPGRGLVGKAAGQQKVPGISVAHGQKLACTAHFVHIRLQDNLHRTHLSLRIEFSSTDSQISSTRSTIRRHTRSPRVPSTYRRISSGRVSHFKKSTAAFIELNTKSKLKAKISRNFLIFRRKF